MKVNMKKLIVALLVLVLVIGGTVSGTLAWLSASANAVENTFTVGNITIELTETFNAKSNESLNNPDKWVGKIVPGGTQPKDPIITVIKGSEKCYVYAMVENTMKIGDTVVVTPNINANTIDWTLVKSEGNKTLYRYKEIVDAATADVTLPVFTAVTYSGDITELTISELATKGKITVDAYAHQSDNLTAVTTADDAAKTHFGITTP